ncbi:AfsR/SARP family transcriptional regulator [Streptomyces sp. P1-3]|uniref:AfsR/SARP family transcriptional regulator n=1 Tax=Streptomyces sp. P1-3 TaxID=3421658 RepID=UPI003D367DA9
MGEGPRRDGDDGATRADEGAGPEGKDGQPRYGILGTTQAQRPDGTAVALGGARLRALLTALALYPGRVRTTDVLIAEVWPDEPPRDPHAALQALVARLRRALGKDTVRSAPGGYRLSADPEAVDLHRFERLADDGARALTGGDPATAAALLDQALALWRGPACADLPDRTAPAARADARHLAARRDRAEADIALGRAEEAVLALTQLSGDHPLDEPLHAARIRALRAAGRPAEALAAYEAVREDLVSRLGTDPGPALRALHAELLAPPAASDTSPPAPHRPAAPHDPPAPHRPAAPTGPGPGAIGPGPAAPGPAGAAAAPGTAGHGNLRARFTSFVGREDDLAALRGDLAAHRLVTLLGPGGAGKTRLSQEAADAVARGWPDGVWFVELAPLDDPGTVPEAVLTALGARETVIRGTAAEGLRAAADPAERDPYLRLGEHCAARRMLLVLDNCEHLVHAAAHLAEWLLAHCPGVAVLATSREPLAVPGELVRPVDPLPDPVALRLLQDRGASARPGFRTDDDPTACAEICRRLDGLPLAIELAAARLRSLTPRQLADRLDDRFRLLTSGSRTSLPRQQTLRAVVDWSWDLLDEPERVALRRLSAFAGGCDLTAAEAVCADSPPPGSPAHVDPRDVAALLGSLVDKSLVVATPHPDPDAVGGGMRYRLLETVAEYAAERLDAAGEREAVERRHLVAYRELARAADPLLRGPAQRVWLDRLELEHDNLRTALRRAVAAGDEQEALCLVLSLGWFWQLRGHGSDARHWSAAAARLGPSPLRPPVTPAPPLSVSPIDAPPPMPPELLQEARRGVRLISLANMDGDMTVLDEQQEELRDGLVAAYRPGLPQTCRTPGVMWFYAVILTGDFELLRKAVDGAVAASRELGLAWELAFGLHLRAKMVRDTGGTGSHHADADESLRIFTEVGDAWGAAEALSARGELFEAVGEYEAAAADYRAAIGYAHELGALAQVEVLRARLAGAQIESPDPAEAEEGERVLRDVSAGERHIGVDAVAYAQLHLALRYGGTGRTDAARAELRQVMQQFHIRELQMFQGVVEGLYAWLDVQDGRAEEALARVRVALPKVLHPVARVVAPQLPTVQLLTAARTFAAIGGAGDAAAAGRATRLIGAYDALRGALRDRVRRLPFMEQQTRTAAEDLARAELGDAAYERHYAEGRGMTLEDAIALVQAAP